MGDSRIKDVSALLSSFFNEDKLRRGERFSDFFSSWSEIVGDRLAAHSRVADVDKGFLVVEAEHPGWIQLLQLRQSGILEDAARRFPELGLRGIVFRLSGQGGSSRLGVRPATAPEEPEPSPESLAADEAERASVEGSSRVALDAIADPEFKKLLTGLKDTMLGKE